MRVLQRKLLIGTGITESTNTMETPEDSKPDLVHQAEPAQDSQHIRPYFPIDSERGDMRLLELAPGEFDDPVVITLVESNLSASEERPYEALSYVWGTAISSENVLLNGVPVEVTSNLDCALRHLRYKLKTRVLWIDALSMNQKDVQERNHQVRIMGRIYSTADKVIIWLGPVDSDDVYLKATLDAMQSAPVLDAEGPSVMDSSFPASISNLIQELQVNTHETCAYDAAYQIMTRPWFSRVWVVQELALSKTADVHIGEYTIPWSTLGEFIFAIKFQQTTARSLRELLYGLYLPEPEKLHKYHPFCEQLTGTLHLSATDPRDKIFGILGISGLETFNIQPDYTKSIQRVFLEVMPILLEKTSHSFYRYAPLHPSRNNLSLTPLRDLPSWVPDFRIKSAMYKETMAGYVRDTMRDYRLPSSLFNQQLTLMYSELEPGFKATFSADLTQLHVIGKPLGTIVRTSGDALYNIGGMHDKVLICKLRRLFEEIARPLVVSAEVFLRALSGSSGDFMKLATREIENSMAFVQSLDPTAASVESSWRIPHEFSNLLTYIADCANKRICFVTDTGDFGLSYHPDTENGIRPGDVITRLFHNNIFFILRPMDDSTYQMVNVANLAQELPDEDSVSFKGVENEPCNGPFSRHTKMSTEEFNALSPEQARQALDVYGMERYTIV
ncbi:hypothetical protein N0V94_008480 [Neodidymelliopsis sp. IMI 364377]|nr:hypothetical protein N0V94_008480 [Neodidymelliopsis sp. IMI 364377]